MYFIINDRHDCCKLLVKNEEKMFPASSDERRPNKTGTLLLRAEKQLHSHVQSVVISINYASFNIINKKSLNAFVKFIKKSKEFKKTF